jgi:hypothetical protein
VALIVVGQGVGRSGRLELEDLLVVHGGKP